MNERNWGGFRVGSGRKATGRNTVNITLTLSKEEADELKARAKSQDLTVSRFVSKWLFLDRGHGEPELRVAEPIRGYGKE